MDSITIYIVSSGTGELLRSTTCGSDQIAVQLRAGEGLAIEPPSEPAWWSPNTGWALKGIQPSINHYWDTTNKIWVDPRTLADLKASKWVSIKTSRDQADSGNFTWEGHVFQVNRININGAVVDAMLAQQAGETVAQVWRLADNTSIILNAAQMISVGRTLKSFVNGNALQSARLHQEIYSDTVTTQDQLDLIVWT